jgi:hypothetical protein
MNNSNEFTEYIGIRYLVVRWSEIKLWTGYGKENKKYVIYEKRHAYDEYGPGEIFERLQINFIANNKNEEIIRKISEIHQLIKPFPRNVLREPYTRMPSENG